MTTDPQTFVPPTTGVAAGAPARLTLRELAACHGMDVLRVLLVNTLIALPLSLFRSNGFVDNLVYSQAIGFTIFFFAVSFSRLLGSTRPDARAMLLAVPLGAIGGLVIGSLVTGDGLLQAAPTHGSVLAAALALAMLLGSLASYVFYARSVISERTALLQQAELAGALDRQRLGEAQLQALQAQIEPHFLFNTLSAVVGLIDEQPATAKGMLVDLTRLLRRSLQRARQDSVPLGEELQDLRAYLDIQSRRMGARLAYAIESDPALATHPVLPYLIQPLVENAIRHGLEPQLGGGRIDVRVAATEGGLTIEVADTGRGLQVNQTPGLALANIRARLAGRHGGGATLSLHPNQPRGVIARLRLPPGP